MQPNEKLPGKYVPLLEFCEHCKTVVKFYKLKKGRAYTCSKCSRHLYYQAGTMFQDSHLHMLQWTVAFYNLKQDKTISAASIQRSIGVTYKTAWRVKKLLLENWEEAEHFLEHYNHPEHFNDEVLQEVGLTIHYDLTEPKFKKGRRQRLMNFESIRLTKQGRKVLETSNE